MDASTKKRLYEYWNEGEIVEMLGVISLFGYLNRWNDYMAVSYTHLTLPTILLV